jgi:predicted membrane channel-forming protein YqfA (hemolysin III family)
MDTAPRTTPPIAFGIAILAAASLMPVTMLMDAMRSPGGDGYSGFGNTLLFLLAALVITVTGVVMGLRRKERFPWLAYVALALWVVPLVMMVG